MGRSSRTTSSALTESVAHPRSHIHYLFPLVLLLILNLCVSAVDGLREFPHDEECEEGDDFLADVTESKFGELKHRDMTISAQEEMECLKGEVMIPNPLNDPTLYSSDYNASVGRGIKIDTNNKLAFCNTSFVDYVALLPDGADSDLVDKKAEKIYNQADRFLNKYNCKQFYPYENWTNCQPCRDAYKRWVCGQFFPMKCKNKTDARRLCWDVCWEVERKCPTELMFKCPLEAVAYGPASKKGTQQRCNPVGLAVSAATRVNLDTLLVFGAVIATLVISIVA